MTNRLLALVLLFGPVAVHAQTPAGVEPVTWLTGCWEATSAAASIEERWMAPRGGSMVGMSRTVRGGAMTAYELLMIRADGERLVYRAHPSGQASAEFVVAAVTADSVVFENPDHDFPKRIGYRRAGDRLTAWIEGARPGEDRREFPYRRVACDGS